MAIFNSFTFDNENSLDSGIYITGEAVFNAPKRVVEMVNVPGRNGAIAIDEGRFENIPVKYPAGCFADNMADFAEKAANFRNILASRFTYKRLEDTYYPDEFRMGLYRSGLEVDVVNQARAGKFDIEFDCKPQRFLKSGEIPVEYTPGQTPSDEQTKTGSIVTFEAEEGTIISDVKADINPVQDLHGYDKPWAGGNGKNLLPMTVAGIKAANAGGTWSGNSYTYFGCTYEILTDADGNVIGIKINGTSTTNAEFWLGKYNYIANTAMKINAGVSTGSNDVFFRVSGDGKGYYTHQIKSSGADEAVNISSNSELWGSVRVGNGKTLSNMIFKPSLVMATETTDFEPYENICPISGHTDVVVSRTGKNLLDTSTAEIGTAWNGASNSARARLVIPLVVGQTYTLKANGTSTLDSWYGIETDTIPSSSAGSVLSNPYTFTATTKYLSLSFNKTAIASTDIEALKLQLEYGSTATSYEPYNGQTYTTPLGRTVYGGTLDVTSGVLTVDRGFTSITKVTSASTNTSGKQRWQTDALTDAVAVSSGSITADLLSNEFTPISADETYRCVNGISLHPNKCIFIYNEEWATKTSSEVNNLLATTPLQVVYELATPITVRLTRTEVKALLGVNNVWADSGDITVKYGTSPYIIVNPTDFPSKPLLEVTGVGSFWLGDTQITITGTSGQIIDIDCESQEAWEIVSGGMVPRNDYIQIAGREFPTLTPGENVVTLGSGITNLDITPRWWRI